MLLSTNSLKKKQRLLFAIDNVDLHHKAFLSFLDNKSRISCVRKHENQFEQDLIAYLDFECELPKVDDRCERCHTVRCKCDTSYTRFETEQKPISFAFYIINKDNEILEEKNIQDLMLLKFLLYCFCY